MLQVPKINSHGDIFKLADCFQYSAQLFFAYTEGLFELLESPREAEWLAEEKRWVPWKTRILLDGLTALGLLIKTDLKYKNSVHASNSLNRNGSHFIGDLVEHEKLQWQLWGELGSVMKADEASALQQEGRLTDNTHALLVFQKAMQQLSFDLIPEILALSHWKESTFVIDLAGGHGAYLIELAKTYPSISGEVWDFEEARAICEQQVRQNGLERRIRFVTKDIGLAESFSDLRCDAVMLNHCLHHFSQSEVYELLKRATECTRPNGTISIVEATLDNDRINPAANALFSTYMMINRRHGQLHPTDWIRKTLEGFGLHCVRSDLDSLESDSLLVANRTNGNAL